MLPAYLQQQSSEQSSPENQVNNLPSRFYARKQMFVPVSTSIVQHPWSMEQTPEKSKNIMVYQVDSGLPKFTSQFKVWEEFVSCRQHSTQATKVRVQQEIVLCKSKHSRVSRQPVAFLRYFQIKYELQRAVCKQCGEVGHTRRHCNAIKVDVGCPNCLGEHPNSSCPQNVCFECQQVSHKATECPNRRHTRTNKCSRCKKVGHEPSRCGILIPGSVTLSQTDLQRLVCVNCMQTGHFQCHQNRLLDNLYRIKTK